MAACRHKPANLDLMEPEIAPFDPPTLKTLHLVPRTKHEVYRITRCADIYGHSKLSKMATGRHLGFDVTRNSAIRSADPENLTLE